jgi:hypothetical protein
MAEAWDIDRPRSGPALSRGGALACGDVTIAALLWLEGFNTADIAEEMNAMRGAAVFTEAQIANAMEAIRAEAQS